MVGDVFRFSLFFLLGIAISFVLVVWAVRRLSNRARTKIDQGNAELASSEIHKLGIGLAFRCSGLYFALPIVVLLAMFATGSVGVARWGAFLPIALAAGIAVTSLAISLLLLGVLPQRVGMILADRKCLTVPCLTVGKKYYWEEAGVCSLNMIEDVYLVVVCNEKSCSRFLVDRESLEAIKNFISAASL